MTVHGLQIRMNADLPQGKKLEEIETGRRERER
jgi:hypothetical protein